MPLHTRRKLLKLAAGLSGAVAIGAGTVAAQATNPIASTVNRSVISKASKQLKVLIFGGTGFIGPHTVNYVLARGHRVSIFSRGRTRANLPDAVEKLTGDRNGDYASLAGREFDLVIDNHTILPRWIKLAAEALKGRIGHYVYISTIGVLKDFENGPITEDAPVSEWGAGGDPLELEDWDRSMYGSLKAIAERELRTQWNDKAVIVRPGLIVGPNDGTDRWTYWANRIARGGEVLSPGNPTDPVQFIDARDLMQFAVNMGEQQDSGLYQATGPAMSLGLAEMLGGLRALHSGPTRLTWVSAEFLESQGLHGFDEIPAWVSPDAGSLRNILQADIGRALKKGLTFRPLADTAIDTLNWWNSLPSDRRQKPRAGIPPAQEAEVLNNWNRQIAENSSP